MTTIPTSEYALSNSAQEAAAAWWRACVGRGCELWPYMTPMTRTEARNWLGVPLQDQAFVEAHLPGLRAAARTAQLPATSARRWLAGLRSPARPLSIQVVYRHLDLFCVLLAHQMGMTFAWAMAPVGAVCAPVPGARLSCLGRRQRRRGQR